MSAENLWAWWAHWSDRQRTVMVIALVGPLLGLFGALVLDQEFYTWDNVAVLVGFLMGVVFTMALCLTMFAMATKPPEEVTDDAES